MNNPVSSRSFLSACLERGLSADAEGEVVVDDVQLERVLAPPLRRRQSGVPGDLQLVSDQI